MLTKEDENKHGGSIRPTKTNYFRMKRARINPTKGDINAFASSMSTY